MLMLTYFYSGWPVNCSYLSLTFYAQGIPNNILTSIATNSTIPYNVKIHTIIVSYSIMYHPLYYLLSRDIYLI